MSDQALKPSQGIEWPTVYLRMFAPLMLAIILTFVVDSWVEYEAGGFSIFFYKNIVTIVVIIMTYIFFGLNKISKIVAINLTVYSIVLGIMILMPFRLNITDFEFETYFLKVEMVIIILTYAIGILVHPKHILYLLALNLVFIATCIIGIEGHYPVSKFIFYIMLMSATSLLGYRLNRLFFELNQKVAAANDVIQAQNEDLIRANSAKDELFEILGHDLKAPFFHLSALLNLMDHTTDQAKNDQYKQMMKNAIREGDELVASILNWVDVQSTYMKFELKELLVEPVVDKAIRNKSGASRIKEITIDKNIQEGIVMNMDPGMMETVLRNLITNAIKFSYRSSTVKILARVQGDEVVISVTDSGIGMTEEVKSELFKYGKIPPRLGTEDETGSGFGLNICKKMVENQKGRLEISSEPDKGTTVSLFFPV